MSGSSAGNYVNAMAWPRSDEDRDLDEAGRKTVENADYTLSLVALATPDQKDRLMVLAAQVRLLASRERAARFEAKLENNEAHRQRIAVGVYERKVDELESEIDELESEVDKLRGQLNRSRSKFAVSMAPSLKGKKRVAKAKKGGAS